MKIMIQTNDKGKVEVIDESTGNTLDNVGKVEIFITSTNKVSALVEFKDVQLKLRVSS